MTRLKDNFKTEYIMACKHCVSDGMCDLKKESPVMCDYFDEWEQKDCKFYESSFESGYTRFEKFVWWVSVFVVFGTFLGGIVFVVSNMISGIFTLTAGILLLIIILGCMFITTPELIRTIRVKNSKSKI